ncbi:hypothetical protein FNT36_02205 [Hymenobacter setariae]|uniref:Uncharacterized protein n=1 Tax=Hymenobacter setariae TaxID=2594794 RepID=A0A558C2I0_9BACT|nr:hypothetical protein [Hymenobacter setariae]TVT42926.1 hypothetical protein FNT36_02205 [Hymenobacter setariae]
MEIEETMASSDSVSDEDLRELWRVRWKASIEELTSLEHQHETSLNTSKSSVHYSFVEFMCCYFDDLLCGLNYGQLAENSYVSEQEKDILLEWHTALEDYNSPQSNGYYDITIWNNPEWQRIVDLGAIAWEKLKLL